MWAIMGQSKLFLGQADDIPIPGDWTGDGKANIAISRPSTGMWAILGLPRVYFGASGDIPLIRWINTQALNPNITLDKLCKLK